MKRTKVMKISIDLNFVKQIYYLQKFINYPVRYIINMDVRGNKLFAFKIPARYLKKQKSYQTFRVLTTLTWKGIE